MNKLGILKEFRFPDGRTFSLETGKLAKQADGAVMLKMGDTMLLATIVSNKEAAKGVDFLPLSVDYKEKYASAGRFPGGFLKRENRPSDYEILISRLVDRAIRPLFNDDYHAETQLLITLYSYEEDCMPDALACLAASAAICVSDIPFNGPVAEVRVARINGQMVINPKRSELENADLDIMLAGSIDNIVMLEGEMKEISEADMIEAIKFGHETIKVLCTAQLELASMVEKAKSKREYNHEEHDLELKARIFSDLKTEVYNVAKAGNPNKAERKVAFKAVIDNWVAANISEEELDSKKAFIKTYYHDLEKEAIREVILNEKIRLDGRGLEDIRPIWSEVSYLPGAHGSAVFTRGETQSLTTVTLGTKLDEQMIDGAIIEGTEKFILHYNFPAFSTGEAKPNRGPGRREVGHGNLALRALKQGLPPVSENPYTIRIVSDVLESNGSSSMATVCAGSLALMDAGVKLKKPVSGIAMGLITDSTGKFAVLSDILGDEDHLGDMDFKVCGTEDGITACQMDIKVDGLSYEVLGQALEQAKKGRLHILSKINETLAEPREDYKPNVPRIVQIRIPKEFIGAIIGPGGKIIQEMQKETNTVITIEEKGEEGIIDVSSQNKEGIEAAIAKIKRIAAKPELNGIYLGKVKTLVEFGAFVEIMPGKDGLLHISEIDHKRVENVKDVLKEGDEIEVKLIEIDKKTGKLKLSRKVLLPRPERPAPAQSETSAN